MQQEETNTFGYPSYGIDKERLASFGEGSKAQTLSQTVHNDRYQHGRSQHSQNTYLKDYQSDSQTERNYKIQQEGERDNKIQLEIELASKLRKIQELYLKQREYQRTIHQLKIKLDSKSQDDYYRKSDNNQFQQENTRLSSENIRLKKQLLSQQFQIRMVQTQMQALKQEDNSSRLREQLKIKQQYHKKSLKQLDTQRQIQIDRIVKLFEDYIQDLQIHYKEIIKGNNITISQNISATFDSVQRAFLRNKQKQINRIGMQFINYDSYQPNKVKSKAKTQQPTHIIQDNSTQVIQRIKEQLNCLNRLKQRQIEQIRNVKDKYKYLDTETQYQKIYLGLIVQMQSLRYHRIIHKSSLEEQAQIIQLKSEIKILNEQLGSVRRQGLGQSKQSKLKKELDILKDYIKQQNESKIRFFSDLQKTKTSYQQINTQNSNLKKQIQMLTSRYQIAKNSSKNSNDYRLLETSYNELKDQLIYKNTRILELQKFLKHASKPTPQQQTLTRLQVQLNSKEVDQLKLFSEIQSLQNEIIKLKNERDEYLDVIKRLGANIETEQELKNMLSHLQKQNIQLKSENQMIKQSLSQQNITRATNEACRLITQRYERQIHVLKINLQKMKQQLVATQKMNGQLLQDLRVVNQHTKTKGVAVEHLWEVKNAEYQNIMGQIKRIQTL